MFSRVMSLALLIFMVGCATKQAYTPILQDKKWVTQTLSNGFQYHLYPLDTDEIELRLILNVGSLHESSSQRGYAHFIEHMAFKNTEHFQDGILFDELNDVGVEFGPDLNATTDYSRTIYKLSLPDKTKLRDAVTWLADVLHGIQFKDDDVIKEKQVIYGEWRLDDKTEQKWEMQLYDYLLFDSPYANKDPIGSEDTLDDVSARDLRQFYKQWYQPQRAQLIVVGGIEPTQLNREIRELFSTGSSSFRTPSTPAGKHYIQPIKKQRPYPAQLTAREGQSAALILNIDQGDYVWPRSLEQQKAMWLEWMVMDAIESKLRDQFERAGLPFLSLYSNFAFMPGSNRYELIVEYNYDQRQKISQFLAKTLASIRDHGLTKTEYNTLINRFESLGFLLFNAQAEEIANTAVQELFFNQLPQDEDQLSTNYAAFLESMTINKIDNSIEQFLSHDNKGMTYVVDSNEALSNAAVKALTAEFFSTLNQAGQKIEPKQIVISLPALKSMNSKGIKVEQQDDNLYAWTLSNDLKIQFYQMNDLTDTSHVILRAKGGIAALSKTERAALTMLYETYINGDVKNTSAIDLIQSLKNTGINIEPAVYSSSHDFSVTTHTHNLPKALLSFLYVIQHIQPNEKAFKSEKQRVIQGMQTLSTSAYETFQRDVKQMVYPTASYESPVTIEDYQRVTFEDVVSLYNKLYGDLGNYSVFIVSNEAVNQIKEWTSTYLGNLSATRIETLPNLAIFNQKGGTLIQSQSPEQRTFIEKLHITQVKKRDIISLFSEELINRILQKRYTEIMREEHGFDYNPLIYSWGRDGDDIHITTVTALISPEREGQLEGMWPEIVKSLTKPITKKERTIAVGQLEKDLLTIRENGEYMVAALARYGTWGYDFTGLLSPHDIIDRISNKELNALTQSIFNHSLSFNSILRPKENIKKEMPPVPTIGDLL